MEVGAIILAIAVAGVLVYWFVFRWDAPRKKWCVMFYLTSNTPASAAAVSRPQAEIGIPSAKAGAATLDQKLDQVVSEYLRQLPCATTTGIAANPDWDDVYVVYRAVWDKPSRSPEARVVRPEISAPSSTYFPGETIFDVAYAIDFTKDIKLFFEWAYDKCPADHYAVFFWGHAMGPAGFFQPSETPVVVSPLMAFLMKIFFFMTGTRWSGTLGLPAISEAVGAIVQQRYAESGVATVTSLSGELVAGAPPTPGGSTSQASSATPNVFTVGQPIPKVDVVLFQDCWMGTLETAFELQDDVRYIVSSQSLVPAGFAAGRQLGAVWPYQELIETLLKQPTAFEAPLMQVLKDFYNGTRPPEPTPGHNRYPLNKVLFSLLDCGTTAGAITSALQSEYLALVQALYPLGAAGRSALIELSFEKAGRLYELAGGLIETGDQALIDMLTLCRYLQTPSAWPTGLGVSMADQNAITAAAQNLEHKLSAIVPNVFQAPAPAVGDLPYTGVAALYKPYAVFGEDPYIVAAYRSSYENFRFARETDVGPAPSGGGTSAQSWTQYAFDRYAW